MPDSITNVITILISAVMLFLVLKHPYWGIIVTGASILLVGVLPDIPMFSSVVTLFGGLTLLSYILNGRERKENGNQKISPILPLGLLFIGWMFLSNPEAAWYAGGRNWVFTYGQLLVLSFLTSKTFNNHQKYRTFMWVFGMITIVSSVIAMQQGYVDEEISLMERGSGITEDINAAARYFVVGLIFLSYLRAQTTTRLYRIITTAGFLITFLGVFFTVSRTGMVLLFLAIGLLILINRQARQRVTITIATLLGVLALSFLSDSIFQIIKDIYPAIMQGTDTTGLRYKLWDAGWRMWLDYPIQGVGIGMFPTRLISYARGIPLFYSTLVAHNTYIQVLSETGLVGFVLFLSMIGISLKNLWPGKAQLDPAVKTLQNTWFIVLIVLLIGCITKNQSADKLLWITMGVSTFFGYKKKEVESTMAEKYVYKPVAFSVEKK